MNLDKFTIPADGDVCVGDTIAFVESVFAGDNRRPRYLGERTVLAFVEHDSYGQDKQQHTFTLRIIACEGVRPLIIGGVSRRKGRNVYRNGVRRMPWEDEAARLDVLADKHRRGDAARADRRARKIEAGEWT